MTSDGRLVELDLVKVRCKRCTLVRCGTPFSGAWLQAHYAADYRSAVDAERSETIVRVEDGVIGRSEAISRWVVDAWNKTGYRPPSGILEIGCGEGRVLDRLRTHWPHAKASGLELGANAVRLASERGLHVEQNSYELASGRYDLIYAIAVLEHVPSPTHFISHLTSILSSDGALLVMQPCQEDVSHDIFFIDHLHHFHLAHIKMFAEKLGLKEIYNDYPNVHLPHFSLHVIRRADNCGQNLNVAELRGVTDPIDRSIDVWNTRFAALDAWLTATSTRDLYVWGIGEFLSLLSAYTAVGSTTIKGGFDDNLERFANNETTYPVERELPNDLPNGRILVTFRINGTLKERLEMIGIPWFCPLL
jgi:cyclopropane fatty-acyl-phospholipid synthase-like methyltransferase